MRVPATPSRFGFLCEPIGASFAGVRIEPLPDHPQRIEWYRKHSNVDGFFYPPQIATYTRRVDGSRGRKVPRTTRRASVFQLPASHTLSVAAPLDSTFPHSDAALIIHLLAFIFGTRLQFEEWRFDGRVPTDCTLAASITTPVRVHFVQEAYTWWKALPSTLRIHVVSLLYAFNRANSAEWEWDAFYQHYMVFDGLFHLHAEMKALRKKIGHMERFAVLCASYGIPYNDELVKKLYRARNQLFHEAMWADAMIGHRGDAQDTYYYPRHLARLNARILCAITGYQNSFTSSVWWAMGRFHFPRVKT